MSANTPRSQRARRPHYRVAPARSRTDSAVAERLNANSLDGIIPEASDAALTNPLAAFAPERAPQAEDTPTIVLTPAEIAALANTPLAASPPFPAPPPPAASPPYFAPPPPAASPPFPASPPPAVRMGYAAPSAPPEDAPTIMLEVGALLAMPPPPPPVREAAQTHHKRLSLPAMPTDPDGRPASWPRPAEAAPLRPHRPGDKIHDPEREFAQLRGQRLARDSQAHPVVTDPRPLTSQIRRLWDRVQPGLERVMGRAHRSGFYALGASASQTSTNLPAVRLRADDDAPAIAPRSSAARAIGERASTAAVPALRRLHSRAEEAAQRLVEKIDASLGATPPMKHVLLGPGRMIIAFAPGISIRNAQIVIASVQARPLRRLVGYNAYLVLVPPGRESRYAERLHDYREVTGVHFGSSRG